MWVFIVRRARGRFSVGPLGNEFYTQEPTIRPYQFAFALNVVFEEHNGKSTGYASQWTSEAKARTAMRNVLNHAADWLVRIKYHVRSAARPTSLAFSAFSSSSKHAGNFRAFGSIIAAIWLTNCSKKRRNSFSATKLTRANDFAIRGALEAASVEFIDENGGRPRVRLRDA